VYIKDNTFKPNIFLQNKHVNTLYRYFFSKVKVNFKRERIHTLDNDFLDLDISKVKSDKAVIVIHGLEGGSDSNYIHTIAELLNKNNYDVYAFNMRGCSGEPNKLLSSYHSGKTEDLLAVINHIEIHKTYKQLHIVGYSLGGNLAIKFMGEFADKMPAIIKSAVTISVPCDLKGSTVAIAKWDNTLYMKGFLKTLKEKTIEKISRFPEANINKDKVLAAKNFFEFDNLVTAPINGFKDAEDYWKQSSCKQYIKKIKHQTLLITSEDDPFLTESCMPIAESENHKYFTFLQPKYGGHIGFVQGFNMKKQRWCENKIVTFIQQNS